MEVLLVEDSQVDAKLILEMLADGQDSEYSVTWVQSTAEAKAAFLQGDYDIALVDLGLPDTSGPETCERIMEIAPGIPLVVVTSCDQEWTALRLLGRGVQDFLVKGEFSRQRLTSAMKWAVQRKQSEGDLHKRMSKSRGELSDAQQRLREETAEREKAQQLLFLALECSGHGVWDWDLKAHTGHYSEAGSDAFMRGGANSQEAFDAWLGRVYPEDRKRLLQALDVPSGEGSSVVDLEVRAELPSGAMAWLHLRGRVVDYDESGSASRIAGTALDVTQRKEAGERLRESETRYRTMMAAMPDAVFICNAEDRILYMNAAMEAMVGQDAAGAPCHRAVFGLSEPCPWCDSGDDASHSHTQEIVTNPRTDRIYQVFNAPIVHEDGSKGRFGIIRDITEQKRAESDLVRLREALDDCGSPLAMLSPSLELHYMNASFGQLFEYTLAQIQEIDIQAHFEDRGMGRDILNSVLAGASWQGELRLLKHGEKSFPASLRITPVLSDDFEVLGVLLIAEDLTELKAMQGQLVQSQNIKAIGQLAAGVAHEINTPMQYLGDNTRFLTESFDDLLGLVDAYRGTVQRIAAGESAADLLDALKEKEEEADLDFLREDVPQALSQSLEGIERVTSIVSAMRQFTHPGTEEKKLVDLNKALDSTITVSRNEWKYAAEMETKFDPELPAVPCLPVSMNQVFLNLIVNAAHAIDDKRKDDGEKGRITVSTRHDATHAEVRIADTGCGIPEEVRAHIFDPFFTTKDVGRGTGQGLAIAADIVIEKHQGILDFESEPGKGTTFIIRLPIDAETAPPEEERAASAALPAEVE